MGVHVSVRLGALNFRALVRLCRASQSKTVSTSAGVDPPHTSELRMDDSSKTRMQYGSLSYLHWCNMCLSGCTCVSVGLKEVACASPERQKSAL